MYQKDNNRQDFKDFKDLHIEFKLPRLPRRGRATKQNDYKSAEPPKWCLTWPVGNTGFVLCPNSWALILATISFVKETYLTFSRRRISRSPSVDRNPLVEKVSRTSIHCPRFLVSISCRMTGLTFLFDHSLVKITSSFQVFKGFKI